MKTIYNVDYFINKFEAIPESKWCINTRADGLGNRCALGWCYPNDAEAKASEMGSYGGNESPEDRALVRLFKVLPYPWVGGTNNGMGECPYKQETPKQRILSALYDIKAKQQPIIDTPKEKTVYVTVDAKVRSLQKEENIFQN